MSNDRRNPSPAGKRRGYLSLVCLAVALCLAQAAAAQSGRGQRQQPQQGRPAPSATPVNAGAPAAGEPAINPPEKISNVIVAGNILHDAVYFRSNHLGAALDECAERFKKRLRAPAQIVKGGRLTFNEAKERARKETDFYVLWMEFVTKDDGWGGMAIDFIDFALLTPGTAKIPASGRIDLSKPGLVAPPGAVMRLPRRPRRPIMVAQMRSGASEVADRLIAGGWF